MLILRSVEMRTYNRVLELDLRIRMFAPNWIFKEQGLSTSSTSSRARESREFIHLIGNVFRFRLSSAGRDAYATRHASSTERHLKQ
jgi:hypothetical protein